MATITPIQLCENELTNLTEFQKFIHRNKSDNDMTPIKNPFDSTFTKVFCYSMSKIKIPSMNQGGEKKFTIDSTLHLLADSYLLFKTPLIEVKPGLEDKVRIAWCHNLMHNIIKEARFEEDGIVFNNYDNYCYDISTQFLKCYEGDSYSKRLKYLEKIGNIPALETFSNRLVSIQLGCPQPFFYSSSPECAFPIYKLAQSSRARHTFKFNLELSKLLRMQYKKNTDSNDVFEEWEDADMTSVDINSIINVKGDFSEPELYGCYINYDKEGLEYYMNSDCRGEDEDSDFIFIKDIIQFDSNKYFSYGDVAEPAFSLNTKTPCLALFWMAENIDSKKFNNHSNYTTNPHDIKSGFNPIESHSLTVNSQSKIINYESIHFDSMDPIRHFPTVPYENGYFGNSFCWQIPKEGADYGVIFRNDKLACKIEDTNPFINDKKLDITQLINLSSRKQDKDNNKTRFKLICRGLVLRKIRYYRDDKKNVRIVFDE